MTDAPIFHYIETNMINLFGNKLYRQIVGIQMGTNSFYIEDKLEYLPTILNHTLIFKCPV